MEKQTMGAWIVHHAQKLNHVEYPEGYESVSLAGKCGILLSAISNSEEQELTMAKIETFAKSQKINPKLELPAILKQLERHRLLDLTDKTVQIIGLTQSGVLQNAAVIFEANKETGDEEATLNLSEKISERPMTQEEAMVYLTKEQSLSADNASGLILKAEEYSFFDAQDVDKSRLLFNGNIFRKEDPVKISKVLGSLTTDEKEKYLEIQNKLKLHGCIERSVVVAALGEELLSKLQAIGFLDLNEVCNDKEAVGFVTLPSAFNKYGNSLIEDSFDYAKALVASITYGMTKSSSNRGRIVMVDRLLRKLIQGDFIGPATAIGHDYKVLELNGIIEVREEQNGLFSMRLLKREVGEIALRIFQSGDSSEYGAIHLPQASFSFYNSPEVTRTKNLKKQVKSSPRQIRDLLTNLRIGGAR